MRQYEGTIYGGVILALVIVLVLFFILIDEEKKNTNNTEPYNTATDIEYREHRYIWFHSDKNEGIIVHDPDCQCMDKYKQKTDTVVVYIPQPLQQPKK